MGSGFVRSMGADLTVVARSGSLYTANTSVDGCSFVAGMAQFSPTRTLDMFLEISFDFVHR